MSLKKYQHITNLKKAREQGFTIVELLIVIIVIAILAALVITAYSGVQQRARDAERQSDIRAIANAIAVYTAKNGGNNPITCATSGAFGLRSATTSIAPTLEVDGAVFKAPPDGATNSFLGAAPGTGVFNSYGCTGTNPITLHWREENGNNARSRTVDTQ